MIISLPKGLPAAEMLRKEGLAVIEERSQMLSNLDPVRIALLNLMPDKPTTETQFARQLARSPFPIELVLVRPGTHQPKGTSSEHMERFYQPWPTVKEQKFDGFIVTGAPVEQLAFEDVTYWPELRSIFDWASASVPQSLYVCWAGQAFLYHRYGINKQMMFTKLFGVFEHDVAAPSDSAMRGVGERFGTPVSRHTEVHEGDIADHGSLTILARSEAAGACIVRDKETGALINFNHLEYDADTLAREYLRDRGAALDVLIPENYFPGDDPGAQPRRSWAAAAEKVFTNWIADAREGRKVAAGEPSDGEAHPAHPCGPAA
jgi:homoserine O-succinyltransferase